MKVSFTNKKIRDLPVRKLRYSVFDEKIPALELLIHPKGTKTFCFYKRIGGIPTHKKIGNYPEITVEVARQVATHLQDEINAQKNPLKNSKLERMLFQKGYEMYIEDKNKLAPSTVKEYQRLWDSFLATTIGKERVADIDGVEIQEIHRKLSKSPYQANRVVALIKAIFNHLIRKKGYQGINPALTVDFNKEEPRTRILSQEEIGRVVNALETDGGKPTIVSCYIALLMMIPVRRSSLLEMKWADVDLEKRQWVIPHTKRVDNLIQVIPDMAMPFFEYLKSIAINEYVFPSIVSKAGHLVEPRKAFKRALKRAGVDKSVRLHDLRHTFASNLCLLTGGDRHSIKVALGHTSLLSSERYVNLTQPLIKDKIEKTTESIMSAISTSNIFVGGEPDKDETIKSLVLRGKKPSANIVVEASAGEVLEEIKKDNQKREKELLNKWLKGK